MHATYPTHLLILDLEEWGKIVFRAFSFSIYNILEMGYVSTCRYRTRMESSAYHLGPIK
jgi:hypothetical protein